MSDPIEIAAYSKATSLPARGQAKALVLLLLAVNFGLIPLFYFRRDSPAAVFGDYALPALLVMGLILAIQIARVGTATLSPAIFLPGLLFIIGGAVFDMTATILHTPDLSQEQNPIARTLLDGGHSTFFVYSYGFICQSLYLAFVAVLWLGLLRHRRSIVDSIRGSRTFLESVKAATGGRELSWRQWCLPLHLSELPESYHLLWLIVIIVVASSVDRWYLGLEWFGVVSGIRLWVGTVAVIVGLTVHFVSLWRAARNASIQHPASR